jgi:hypothetical protein
VQQEFTERVKHRIIEPSHSTVSQAHGPVHPSSSPITLRWETREMIRMIHRSLYDPESLIGNGEARWGWSL